MTRWSKPDGNCCWPVGAGEGDWPRPAKRLLLARGRGRRRLLRRKPDAALHSVEHRCGAERGELDGTAEILNHLCLLRGLPRRQREEDFGREWRQ